MSKEKIRIFEENWKKYDEWFEHHQEIYQSEIKAIKKVIPTGLGLDIGVGTGRFASPFSVQFGLDPSLNMLLLARQRKIKIIQGVGEALPFKNESFNFILIVVTICFANNPHLFLNEAARILKKKGELILAIIDKTSAWGRFYEAKSTQSKYYKAALFFSPEDILQMFNNINLEYKESYQTLLQPPPDIIEIEEPRKGYGKGGFIVLKAIKKDNVV
ncbi:MAG: class I SAM-dependent methyltransferase [Candidatus Aminicenantes bacterium]|nr:class I SAM-dependent methyltransferase [Candidatus Aminicenantes bacterium]